MTQSNLSLSILLIIGIIDSASGTISEPVIKSNCGSIIIRAFSFYMFLVIISLGVIYGWFLLNSVAFTLSETIFLLFLG
jgi:hypothetical protein